MATAISFCAAMDGPTPVIAASPISVEAITASGTSAQTTITAPTTQAVCVVTTTDNVWVSFGANPTAAAGVGHLVLGGSEKAFGRLQPGWKVAVITG